jgi:hypothetical protein
VTCAPRDLIRVSVGLAVLLAAAVVASPQSALPPIALEDSPDSTNSEIILAAPAGRGIAKPFLIRIGVPAAALMSSDASNPIDERVQRYTSRGIRVWLAVSIPASADDMDAWRGGLRRLLDLHRQHLAVLEIATADAPNSLSLFALRIAGTEARSRPADSLQIAVSGALVGRDDRRARTIAAEIAPYVDLLALRPGEDIGRASEWFRKAEPDGKVLVIGQALSDDTNAAQRTCTAQVAWSVGTAVQTTAMAGTPMARDACVAAIARVSRLAAGNVSTLDPAGAEFSMRQDGQDASGRVRHRLLFDQRTTSTLLAIDMRDVTQPLDVSVRVAIEGRPAAVDLETGAPLTLSNVERSPSGQLRLRVPAVGHLVLIDFSAGASDVFTERSAVSAVRQLSVEEVIARHQQRQNIEDQGLRNYIADVRMSQHFRPTLTDPGYDIVTENRYYVDRSSIEWEELSFAINGSKWGADRPPFPMLQPEKVLSLPLQLRFDNDYRYALNGLETVEGIECYAVSFEPVRADRALYRGTVWIDRRTFAKVQVRAVQTQMSAPVVSNEETVRYHAVATPEDGSTAMLTELSARQIIMIAGRNILLERHVTFENFQINSSSFLDRRAEARSGDRIMYRDTDAGVRYLVKEHGDRVVSTRQTRGVKALAMGVVLDPSYAFPLPIFGINYLDFQFGSPDTQLAMLFAGVLAAGNIQRAKLGGTPLDGSLDFFAIAAPATDRVFDSDEERDSERLLTWPLTTGANLGWQYTAYQKLTLQYQFRFDGYVRERTTSESFRVPSSTITNGIGGAWELKRGGYSLVANGALFGRASWKPWGAEGTDEDSSQTYAKYMASLSRDFYVGPFQKLHLNGAYFGGRKLDRFSKYQFGMFDDTRIHGVPASGIRFDELSVARGSYSFNLFDQYRFDVFLDQGWGRDRQRTLSWQPITGIGIAINVRAPWSTILRADVGKSFLPAAYSGQGSATAQIMLLKPLR